MILLSSYFFQLEERHVYWIWLSSLLMILPPSFWSLANSIAGISSVYNVLQILSYFLSFGVLGFFLPCWICRYLKPQFSVHHNSPFSSFCCRPLFLLLISAFYKTNSVIAGRREKGKEKVNSSAIFRVFLIITNIVLTFLPCCPNLTSWLIWLHPVL